MTTLERKDMNLRTTEEARCLAKHWKEVGGIVVDVLELLESVARINIGGLSDFDCQHLRRIKYKVPLVASHALRPVLQELNHEAGKWTARAMARLGEDD